MKAIFSATIACLAILALTSSASAGAYQHTLDGQTFVWNKFPDPNDSVSWSGQRDRERYATGPGTLTWYKGGVRTSRYSGTMFRGRWNGAVTNEDADGKTYRGTYVNGNKSNDWVQTGGPSSGGQGQYEKTADGRGAYVWNNYPKPGDQATWTGEVDSENYATGEGQINWFKNGTLVTSYYGEMVKGKLEGAVTNLDADGKKYQGVFVNGVKTGDWAQVEEYRRVLTLVAKELNEHWLAYLKEIQNDNDYANWSARPFDLYANRP